MEMKFTHPNGLSGTWLCEQASPDSQEDSLETAFSNTRRGARDERSRRSPAAPIQIRGPAVSHGIRSQMYAAPVEFEEAGAPATTVVFPPKATDQPRSSRCPRSTLNISHVRRRRRLMQDRRSVPHRRTSATTSSCSFSSLASPILRAPNKPHPHLATDERWNGAMSAQLGSLRHSSCNPVYILSRIQSVSRL